MSIQTPAGTLDINNATLRVGRLEVSNIQGIDTALNVARSNSILIYDDQASTTTFGGFTSSPGVRDTVGGYLDVAGGYVYWGQKLPNAWTMEFEMDIRSGTNAGPLYANVFSSTNTGGDGYSFTYNDSNDKITLMYNSAVLTETTVPGLFTASENWQKVVIDYERNTISISLNGQRAFYYKDIERETPYTTGEYVNVSSSSIDGRKIRAFKVTNGDKWTYSGESNITYTHGSLGIGVVDPTATLDVAGTVKAIAFVGDGSAITNINSGNIGDFASNVERIASLEVSNVSIWSNLASNVARIASLEASNVNIWSNLASNVARIESLETSNVSIWSNLASNVARIVSLESEDMTISGDKTFSNNVFVTTLKDSFNKYLPMVNTDGKLIRSPVYVSDSGKYVISASEAEFLGNITLSGNTTVVSSTSVTIEDRIFGIGSNNSLTNLDSGIIIEHQDSGVYANVALIHHADEHRFSLGYTQNTFTDDHVLHYDHPDNVVLTVDLRGDVLIQNTLDVTSNLQVGTANLFVDTTTSNVGIGTTTPGYTLDVHGTSNVGALTATGLSVAADTDNTGIIGRAKVGNMGYADHAGFAHYDRASTGNYALLQGPIGDTFINASTGKGLYFRENNADKMVLSGGNLGIGVTPSTYKLDVGDTAPYISVTDTRTSSGGVSGLDLGGIVFRTKDATDPVPETGDFLGKIQMTTTNTEAFPDGSMNFFVSNRGDLLTTPSITIEGVSGNVGIGTTNPAYTLDVHGTSNVGTLTATSGTFSGDINQILYIKPGEYKRGVAAAASDFKAVHDVVYGVAGGGTLYIEDSVDRLRVDTTGGTGVNPSMYLYIKPYGGTFKLPIGWTGEVRTYGLMSSPSGLNDNNAVSIWTSPDNTSWTQQAIVQVGGGLTSTRSYDVSWENSTPTTEELYVRLYYDATSIGPSTNIRVDMISISNIRMRDMLTYDRTKLIVKDSGNVGIGTTSPSYTLDVHGTSNVGTLTATSGTFSGTVHQSSLPAFRVQLTDGSIAGTGIIDYNAVLYDNMTSYSAATGRFTVPVTGHYFFSAHGICLNTRTIYDFTVNGIRQQINSLVDASSADFAQCTISAVLYLTKDQYVSVYQVQGSTYGESTTSNHNLFSGFFIG